MALRRFKTMTRNHSMYKCRLCGKLTRLGSLDGMDAEFRGECVPCWEQVMMEAEHEHWKLGDNIDHDCENCPLCKDELRS